MKGFVVAEGVVAGDNIANAGLGSPKYKPRVKTNLGAMVKAIFNPYVFVMV